MWICGLDNARDLFCPHCPHSTLQMKGTTAKSMRTAVPHLHIARQYFLLERHFFGLGYDVTIPGISFLIRF